MVIDSHAHVISRDRARYPLAPLGGAAPEWLDERGVDTDELLERMDAAGVSRAVLVQFGAAHGYDNRYVLDSADEHPERLVAVCALDGQNESVAELLSKCLACGAVGVRLRAPDRGPALDWLECENVWRCAAELSVPVAIHLMTQHHVAGIALIKERMRQFPSLRVVLDHVGNPPWQADAIDLGLRAVSGLADAANFVVKFSSVNLNRLDAAHLNAGCVLSRLVQIFGAERIMWGSDAPNTPGDYSHLLQRMRAAATGLSSVEQALIFGGTAARVYPKLQGGPD
jgi:L-fuconolactonase